MKATCLLNPLKVDTAVTLDVKKTTGALLLFQTDILNQSISQIFNVAGEQNLIGMNYPIIQMNYPISLVRFLT